MDTLFLLKLVLTPIFIGAVTAFGRRYGPRASGWLAGLPLTSGPISVFLALEQGIDFAADAAPATILGIIPVASFCLAWAMTARRGLLTSYLVALLAYVATAPFAVRIPSRPWLALLLTLTALLLALLLMPLPRLAAASLPRPRWDVGLRMSLATWLVVLLTGTAHLLGPTWTGFLSPFPVFASVLAGFQQRHEGPDAAILVLRGILTGVLSFCAFFFLVALLLPLHGIGPAYAFAAGAAIVINGVNGMLMRRAIPGPSR